MTDIEKQTNTLKNRFSERFSLKEADDTFSGWKIEADPNAILDFIHDELIQQEKDLETSLLQSKLEEDVRELENETLIGFELQDKKAWERRIRPYLLTSKRKQLKELTQTLK